jgi:hypothetical protein
MPNMTTTKAGFRVEDITFKNARQQSAILDETDQIESEAGDIEVPVSLTPEQVKNFFEAKIEVTYNGREKKLYRQTIKWIDEMLDTKKKLLAVEEKLETIQKVQNANSEVED